MKSLMAGAFSGCTMWGILFFVTVPCFWSLIFMTSSLTTFTDPSYQIMQPILCPANTRLTVRNYDTTTTDSSHHSIAAVGHDMNCVASGGQMVKKNLDVEYLLWWRGLGIVSGVVVAFVVSLLLAAPFGALVTRFLHGIKSPQPSA